MLVYPLRNSLEKKLESPSPKDGLCQVWLKLARWFWRSLKTDGWTDRRTTYDRQLEKLSAGELKICRGLFSKFTTVIYVRYMHVISTWCRVAFSCLTWDHILKSHLTPLPKQSSLSQFPFRSLSESYLFSGQ